MTRCFLSGVAFLVPLVAILFILYSNSPPFQVSDAASVSPRGLFPRIRHPDHSHFSDLLRQILVPPTAVTSMTTSSPVESILLRNFEAQRDGSMPFRALYLPSGTAGIGNDLLGLTNVLLYALFWNCTVFISPRTGFKIDGEMSFFSDGWVPRNPLLRRYMSMPPEDTRLRELILTSRNHCWGNDGKNSGTGFVHNDSFWNEEFVQRFPSRFLDAMRGPRSHHRSRTCGPCGWFECETDLACRALFRRHRLDFLELFFPAADFFCLHTWDHGPRAAHVFTDPILTDFVCGDLGLCEGLQPLTDDQMGLIRDMVAEYELFLHKLDVAGLPYDDLGTRLGDVDAPFPPEMPVVLHHGWAVQANLFRAIFQPSPSRVSEIRKIEEQLEGSDVVVAFHIREEYIRFEIDAIVENCLWDRILKHQIVRRAENVTFVISSDSDDVSDKIEATIRRILPLAPFEIPSWNIFRNREDRAEHVVDSSLGGKSRALLDLHLLTLGDILVGTSTSTFSAWGYYLGRAFRQGRRPYLFGCSWYGGKGADEPPSCTHDEPFAFCWEKTCPLDWGFQLYSKKDDEQQIG